MKFAIIGAAHGHIMEFADDMLKAGGEFTGIYNDRSEYVEVIAQKYNVPVYDDVEKLFSDGIQVVGTSAVNNRKIDIIELCSRHGVHVMADKPIVTDESQLERLRRVMDEGGIQVGMMLTVRFMPIIYTMKKLIDSGSIGRLLGVEIFSPHRLKAGSRPAWHFEKEENGGVIIDLMVHSIDLYRWLTQSEITGFMGTAVKSVLNEKETFYDCSQFFVRNSSGAAGYFRVDWHIPDTHWNWGDMRVFCTGSKGIIEARAVGDPVSREAVLILLSEGSETSKVELEACPDNVTSDFLKRVRGEKSCIDHNDIYEASKCSIEMDKQAVKTNFCK